MSNLIKKIINKMPIKRRSFVFIFSIAILSPFFLLKKKSNSIKIINGWILKSEDFK